MKKRVKIQRRALARTLSIGCNALDSIRIMTIGETLRLDENEYEEPHGVLTKRERRLLRERYQRMDELIKEVRKIAHYLQRSSL